MEAAGQDLKNMKSSSSLGSSRFDQSQKTGLSGSLSGRSSVDGENSEEGGGLTDFTK